MPIFACLLLLQTFWQPALDLQSSKDVAVDLVKHGKIKQNVNTARHYLDRAMQTRTDMGAEHALRLVERAIKAAPSLSDPRFMLGKLQHELGIPAEVAILNVKRALAIDSKQKGAQELLKTLEVEIQNSKRCTQPQNSKKTDTCTAETLPQPSLELQVTVPNPLLKVHRFQIFTEEESNTILKAAVRAEGWTS